MKNNSNITTVLSLFDGISCARVALDRLGYRDILYLASEVDKYAIQIAQKNYPDTIQLGDVCKIQRDMLPQHIDLLIGGSPCQDLSIAKNNRKGLDGERSGLFWEWVRLWKECQPKYWVLENVNSMPKEAKRIISKTLGVEPIMINAALVSAQSRKRLFWTNICSDVLGNQYMPLPEDRGILLTDILEGWEFKSKKDNWVQWPLSDSGQKRIKMGRLAVNLEKSLSLMARDYACLSGNIVLYALPHGFNKGGVIIPDKYPTLHSQSPGNNHLLVKLLKNGYAICELTPVECERLMTLPDKYTEGISNTQRYKCLGNGFVVEVVKHIMSYMDGLER